MADYSKDRFEAIFKWACRHCGNRFASEDKRNKHEERHG